MIIEFLEIGGEKIVEKCWAERILFEFTLEDNGSDSEKKAMERFPVVTTKCWGQCRKTT